MFDDAVKNGPLLPGNHIGYSQHSYETYPLATNHLTATEVLQFRDNAFMKYFTDPMYLKMMQEKFVSSVVDGIKEMTKIELKRELLGA